MTYNLELAVSMALSDALLALERNDGEMRLSDLVKALSDHAPEVASRAYAVGFSRGHFESGWRNGIRVVRLPWVDDEEFCPTCCAGIESAEHFERCELPERPGCCCDQLTARLLVCPVHPDSAREVQPQVAAVAAGSDSRRQA